MGIVKKQKVYIQRSVKSGSIRFGPILLDVLYKTVIKTHRVLSGSYRAIWQRNSTLEAAAWL